MIYFTSDLHLGHYAVLKFQNRPFQSVDEMNRVLIENINARVKKLDTLYILGDVAHRCPVEKVNEMLAKINGKKILLRGNHDKQYDESLFEAIYDFHEEHFDGHSISLMHYPMEEWPKSRHGSIHLHGHQHNSPEFNEEMRRKGIKRYDVGVDANYYFPVSLQEILSFIEDSGKE